MSQPDRLIASRPLPNGEEYRVTVSEYRGKFYVHARQWYRDVASGEWKPGKVGGTPAGWVPWGMPAPPELAA